ncbi:RcpC/CpaB family pilus assembly protein [Streptomyces sp. TLI_146]|uniref:RcpC/CpaB family pilus assembly protein n=1 Tax=Streptomyces sp. TLI_146 TaxID=1938858 RepID=UPI000C6FF2E2|nr:RcpC/CpaB family pilus assembly protein [Streptomyces sp. TLI_146]PKV86242.1 Flp pilus assembly protein RcpC/CpaB [Streptomyces sp. TLI_146]
MSWPSPLPSATPSSAPSPAPAPLPSPAPEPAGVPVFPPLRVRGSRNRLRRAVRRRRRAMAAGLAVAAAALAAVGARAPGRTDPGHANPGAVAVTTAGAQQPSTPTRPARTAVDVVSAPVRIADAETVRLLRPGDRVDVIAAPDSPPGGSGGPGAAHLVASGVRVTDVPRPRGPSSDEGALVVLAVPRATATTLAGAGATSRLVVTWR